MVNLARQDEVKEEEILISMQEASTVFDPGCKGNDGRGAGHDGSGASCVFHQLPTAFGVQRGGTWKRSVMSNVLGSVCFRLQNLKIERFCKLRPHVVQLSRYDRIYEDFVRMYYVSVIKATPFVLHCNSRSGTET